MTTLKELETLDATAQIKWGRWILESGVAAGLPEPTSVLGALLLRVDDRCLDSAEGLRCYLAQLQPL